MALYTEDFPVGTFVRVENLSMLEAFALNWKYHHALESNQFEFAGHVAEVSDVSFYHGGDVLYQLRGIPEFGMKSV